MTDKNSTIDIPTIKFIRHPHMAGLWSDATPPECGGSGIPIPEHMELYKKCMAEGIKYIWEPYLSTNVNIKDEKVKPS